MSELVIFYEKSDFVDPLVRNNFNSFSYISLA